MDGFPQARAAMMEWMWGDEGMVDQATQGEDWDAVVDSWEGQEWRRAQFQRDSRLLERPKYIDNLEKKWTIPLDRQLGYGGTSRRDTDDTLALPTTYMKRGQKRKRIRTVEGAEFVPYGSVGTGMISLRFFDSTKVAVQLHAPTAGVWTGCELDPDGGCLFHPSLGSGESERLGRVAYMKSIHIIGTIARPAQMLAAGETVGDGATVFLALVRDKQTNGVQLNSEDVYLNAGTLVTGASNPLKNIDNEDRFDIVRTLRVPITLDGGWVVATTTDPRKHTVGRDVPFDWYVRVSDEVRFKSDTGSIDDITDESYHIVGCVNTTHTTYRLSYSCRTRYTC